MDNKLALRFVASWYKHNDNGIYAPIILRVTARAVDSCFITFPPLIFLFLVIYPKRKWKTTPGKALIGIRVIKKTGEFAGFWLQVWRELCLFLCLLVCVAALYLFLTIFISGSAQVFVIVWMIVTIMYAFMMVINIQSAGLHDIITGTRVINKNKIAEYNKPEGEISAGF